MTRILVALDGLDRWQLGERWQIARMGWWGMVGR
jgi:hypothetical protein